MGVRSVVVLGALVLVPLSGCPGGAELENPERFTAGSSGSSGAAGSSGSSGTSGTAGTSGASGTSGTSGSSGAGGGLTFVPPNCNYRDVLARKCGPGCHQTRPNVPSSPIAGLDLVTEGVETRVYGKRPTYEDITCPNPDGGALQVPCLPPGCLPDALLIAPGNPGGSFILQKITGTHGDCGRVMPPGNLDETDRACLEDWVEAVANATVTP